MIGRNSVILDAAEAAVLLRAPLGLLLLRPCPSQPFVEEYTVSSLLSQAAAQRIPRLEMPETRDVWECVPTGENLWHVWYPGHDGGGHGIYETEAEMLDEYRPVMLGRHPPVGAVLDVREPWRINIAPLPFRLYLYASLDDCAGRWNPPAQMPRAAVQMRAQVADVRVVRLKDIPDWDLDALLRERGRRGWSPPWWDSRSFAREDRGTLEHQNPYIYATRLKRQEMP